MQRWLFHLPDDRIARQPADIRSNSRLLHLPLDGGPPIDHLFSDLVGLLRPGDLLVANDTQVLPARLRGHRATGGRVELLILDPRAREVSALAKPAKKLRLGDTITLDGGAEATITKPAQAGVVWLRFSEPIHEIMAHQGELPLPPYLGRAEQPSDRERYQTVFAKHPGAAAAPTAGLHFTAELLDELRQRGIDFETITLHVGLGTFLPLRPEDIERGRLHQERYTVSARVVDKVRQTRERGGRVVAVGTTSARALESATPSDASVPVPGDGVTDIFIRPPYRFRAIDGLITNFHLPGSSLVMLVASLVGRERLLGTYSTAVQRGYRFYSYGDAMLLL